MREGSGTGDLVSRHLAAQPLGAHSSKARVPTGGSRKALQMFIFSFFVVVFGELSPSPVTVMRSLSLGAILGGLVSLPPWHPMGLPSGPVCLSPTGPWSAVQQAQHMAVWVHAC